MSDRELDRLVQDVLEDVARPAERERLERITAADPAAAARRRELERVFERLGRVPPAVPAPPGLRAAVLGRIGSRAARGTGRPVPHRAFRFAIPFALGVVAGALGFAGWRGDPDAPGAAVSGAMMPADPDAAIHWHAGDLTATVTGRRRGVRQALRIVVSGPVDPGDEAAIELRYDPLRTRLVALRQSQADPGGIVASPGHVRLAPDRPTVFDLEVEHADAGAPITARLRAGGAAGSGAISPDFGEGR